jgi:hypothetical protein
LSVEREVLGRGDVMVFLGRGSVEGGEIPGDEVKDFGA